MANNKLEFDVTEFENFMDNVLQEFFILRENLQPIEKAIIHYIPEGAPYDHPMYYKDRKATIKDAKSVAHHANVRLTRLINSFSKHKIGKLPEEKA